MCERLTLTDHTSLRKVILARTDRCVQVKESLVMPRDGDKLDSLLKQAFDEGVS
jgi:DNA-binding protein YbaB